MAKNETGHRLLEEVMAMRDELAPPEREIFEELQAQLALGQTLTAEEDRSLEIILRNVEIRKKTGLHLHTQGNGRTS